MTHTAAADHELAARNAITGLHQHFSATLASAHKIDPDSISEDNPACPSLRIIARAQAETPVRTRVACTLLAAQASAQYGKALTNLYNHAWMQVEAGIGLEAEMAAWARVAEATSTVMDSGLDAEIESLLTPLTAV
ncbi:hypothetical protein LG293_16620 (plasmid) [Citricoccus nitrophenolicus]